MDVNEGDLKNQGGRKQKMNQHHSKKGAGMLHPTDAMPTLWAIARRRIERQLDAEAQHGPMRVYVKDGKRV